MILVDEFKIKMSPGPKRFAVMVVVVARIVGVVDSRRRSRRPKIIAGYLRRSCLSLENCCDIYCMTRIR